MSNTYTSFSGPGVEVFAAAVLASGLTLYAKTGIRPSRAYTPKAMMARASAITGKTFRPRDYEGAARALREWIAVHKIIGVATGDIT